MPFFNKNFISVEGEGKDKSETEGGEWEGGCT